MKANILLVLMFALPFFAEAQGGAKSSKFKNLKYDYELQIPECYDRNIPLDASGTKPETADEVEFTESDRCQGTTAFKKILSVYASTYKKGKTPESVLNDQQKVDLLNRSNSPKLLTQNTVISGKPAYLNATELSEGKVRWSATVACKKRYYILEILTKPNPSDIPKIKSGEIILPDFEKKALESFKCLDGKAKSKT